MKIGMLVDTYLPILGGAEVHVLELSRALRRQGYEISVCTAVPGQRGNGENRAFYLIYPPQIWGR
jgi:glycosyltransferase involved in cell wall biosynthesis